MLPSKHRLEKKLFKILFRTGKRNSLPYFTLVYSLINYKTNKPRNQTSDNKKSHSNNRSFGCGGKIAFIVSSAVSKKAVIRNLLKRRARAIILKYLKYFIAPIFIIFIFKKSSLSLSFNELEKEIVSGLKKAGIL